MLQRDATQRETLSQTIRGLRADALRQTTDLERVNTKHVEAQRKLGLAEATERALKTQLRSAEQAAKGLKEEMSRIRSLVAQTRSQCANEVRKRERVIEGMKRHVTEAGRPRGSGKPPGVATITVVPGVGAEAGNPGALGTDDINYDLRMETNEFLTELAKGLGEENENLSRLLQRTIESLKSLSGCETEESQDRGEVMRLETGYETISAEMDSVIDHIRNLLTNPSFVPLEELEAREEEIIRLRAGWEKMESRWREAIHLMAGWHKRMAKSGQTVNLDELKMGLRLSPLKSVETENAIDAQISLADEYEEGDTQADIDAMDDSGVLAPEPELDDDSQLEDYEEDILDEVTEEPQEEQTEENTIPEEAPSSPIGPPPQLSPLRETTRGNIGGNNHARDGFTTIVEENTFDLLQLDKSAIEKPKSQAPTPGEESSPVVHHNITRDSPKKTSNPTSDASANTRLQANNSSRLPRPRENPLPQQSPLTMATIQAKLAATEREADAARVRAKLKAARLSRANPAPTLEATKLAPPQKEFESNEEPVKEEVVPSNADEMPKPETTGSRKRKAIGRSQGGRTSRRRSTLSPWELESLILGGNMPSPAKGAAN